MIVSVVDFYMFGFQQNAINALVMTVVYELRVFATHGAATVRYNLRILRVVQPFPNKCHRQFAFSQYHKPRPCLSGGFDAFAFDAGWHIHQFKRVVFGVFAVSVFLPFGVIWFVATCSNVAVLQPFVGNFAGIAQKPICAVAITQCISVMQFVQAFKYDVWFP